MSNSQANEERQQTENLSIGTNEWLDLLKEHGLKRAFGFLFGLLCGRGFGWPSFSSVYCLNPNAPRTASGQNAAFQLEQKPNVAAMRWRGWLNALLITFSS